MRAILVVAVAVAAAASASPSPASFQLQEDAPVVLVEAVWPDSVDLQLHLFVEVDGIDLRADLASVVVDLAGDLADRASATSVMVVQQDVDGRVLVAGSGVDAGAAEIQTSNGVLWYNWSLDITDVSGAMRASVWHDAGDAVVAFEATSSGAGTYGAWTGDHVVRWESGADEAVILPAGSVYPADSLSIDIPDRWVGTARTEQDQDAWVLAPDAEAYEPMDWMWMRDPAPGAWSWEFGGYVDDDHYNERGFYGVAGAHYPDLGVFEA